MSSKIFHKINVHKHAAATSKLKMCSVTEGYVVLCVAYIPHTNGHNLDCSHVVTFIRSFTVEYICPAGATHPRSKLNALLPLAS